MATIIDLENDDILVISEKRLIIFDSHQNVVYDLNFDDELFNDFTTALVKENSNVDIRKSSEEPEAE